MALQGRQNSMNICMPINFDNIFTSYNTVKASQHIEKFTVGLCCLKQIEETFNISASRLMFWVLMKIQEKKYYTGLPNVGDAFFSCQRFLNKYRIFLGAEFKNGINFAQLALVSGVEHGHLICPFKQLPPQDADTIHPIVFASILGKYSGILIWSNGRNI